MTALTETAPVGKGPLGGARGRLRVDLLQEYGIIVSFAALFATLALSSDAFLTRTNFLNILDQQSALGVIACAVTLVIIAGDFDLSVGAIFALAGVVGAKTGAAAGPGLGLLTACAVGLGCGAVNGLLVTVGRINSFILTLATALMFGGASIAITGGYIISVENPDFQIVGGNEFAGVKYSVWMLLGAFLITWFALRATSFGRYVYASGGNSEAARLSGIRVQRIRFVTLSLSGLAAGVAGMIVASRVGQAQAQTAAGSDLPLLAIAAVVIGGTSIVGGKGAVWRSMLGVLLLAMITNGFNLLLIDPVYQQIFQGALIVIAVAVSAWARKG